jgi:hypothetical protein
MVKPVRTESRTQMQALAGIALAVLLCWHGFVFAADISVRADRDPVPAGESFQIIFEVEGDLDGDPDFSPLNTDFQVLSTGQASSMSIVPGKITRTKSWTLTVLPKRSGTLTVPPIRFGRHSSPPQTVTIGGDSGSRDQTTSNGDIFIEVEAVPLKPHVQAQVLYTLRLYRAVLTSNATLSDPQVEAGSAIIQRAGEDRHYETRLFGRRFMVLERRFAVFPQGSGTLTLSPARFQGQIGRDTFSLFDPFGARPSMIQRESAPVSIEVQPVPAGFQGGHWLPAQKLTLAEEWSPDAGELHVGDPVTRTVTIRAEGLTASQLPELPDRLPAEIRGYPEPPALSDATLPSGITGTRVERTALIAAAAGEIVFPEIVVPWWNTKSNRMEEARLPERLLKVLPAPLAGIPGIVLPAVPDVAPVAPGTDASAAADRSAPLPATATDRDFWKWLSAALAAGWLLTIFLWYRGRIAKAASHPVRDASEGARAAERDLKRCCTGNDARGARDALLRWADAVFTGAAPRNLHELAVRSSPELANELERLNAVLYARSGGEWDGWALWRAFAASRPQAQHFTTATDNDLEPLYRI